MPYVVSICDNVVNICDNGVDIFDNLVNLFDNSYLLSPKPFLKKDDIFLLYILVYMHQIMDIYNYLMPEQKESFFFKTAFSMVYSTSHKEQNDLSALILIIGSDAQLN